MTGYDIVMLVLNDVQGDSRVQREAAALAAAGWRVLLVGTQRAEGVLPDAEHMQGFDVLRVRYGRYGARLWRPWRYVRHAFQAAQIVAALRRIPTRAYHAHDLPALAVLYPVRRGLPLVYDSHEVYLFRTPDSSRVVAAAQRLTRPLAMAVERFLARRADAIIMTSECHARLVARWYGVPRPVIVYNAVDPVSPAASGVDLRALAGGGRCVVHTGTVTNKGRSLTELVSALPLLPDDVTLVFLGQGVEADALRQLAARLGVEQRVCFVPPVPPDMVAAAVRSVDVAVVLPRSNSLNNRSSLPNKLFEAVAAGVPVVATNTAAVARMVRRFELGLVCESNDPALIAAALRDILQPERQAFFRARVTAAQAALSWQGAAARLCDVYREILS